MSNLLTEAEARAKWCPFARQDEIRHGGVNCLCLASGCMAWRWQPSGSRRLADHSTEQNPAHVDTVSHDRGYCGLAGAP